MFDRRNNRDWNNDDYEDRDRPGYDYEQGTKRNRGMNRGWENDDSDMGQRYSSGYGRGYDYDEDMGSRYGRGMSRDWDNSDNDYGSMNRNNQGYGMTNRSYGRGISRDWDNSDNDYGSSRQQEFRNSRMSEFDNGSPNRGSNQREWENQYDSGDRYGGMGSTSSWDNAQFGRGQHYGRGPKAYQRSDERIQEDVNERLTWHGDIDATHIEVTVSSGDVTLEGTVDSRRAKRMAEDAVEMVRGVKEVHNRLRIQNQGSSQQGNNTQTGMNNTSMTGGAQSTDAGTTTSGGRGNRQSS